MCEEWCEGNQSAAEPEPVDGTGNHESICGEVGADEPKNGVLRHFEFGESAQAVRVTVLRARKVSRFEIGNVT